VNNDDLPSIGGIGCPKAERIRDILHATEGDRGTPGSRICHGGAPTEEVKRFNDNKTNTII